MLRSQEMDKGRQRVELSFPGRTYTLMLKEKALRLKVKANVGGKVSQRVVDLREVFGEEIVKEAPP